MINIDKLYDKVLQEHVAKQDTQQLLTESVQLTDDDQPKIAVDLVGLVESALLFGIGAYNAKKNYY